MSDILLDAVIANNMNEVRKLVNCGADVNYKNFKGATPLVFSVHRNYYEMTKLLIDLGANINYRGSGGSIFVITIQFGHYEIAKLLIDAGTDIQGIADGDSYPWSKRTPLILSVIKIAIIPLAGSSKNFNIALALEAFNLSQLFII